MEKKDFQKVRQKNTKKKRTQEKLLELELETLLSLLPTAFYAFLSYWGGLLAHSSENKPGITWLIWNLARVKEKISCLQIFVTSRQKNDHSNPPCKPIC